MADASYRSACVTALAAAAVASVALAGARPARADDAGAGATTPPPPVSASMRCEHALEPGRVRCSVEARAAAGKTIAWADVVIVALPDFASALKGRIGREDATSRDPDEIKWAFGLVARRAGQGEAKARVRLSLCQAASPPAPPSRCVPITVDVRAPLAVGG
jgi:hypothetical protein